MITNTLDDNAAVAQGAAAAIAKRIAEPEANAAAVPVCYGRPRGEHHVRDHRFIGAVWQLRYQSPVVCAACSHQRGCYATRRLLALEAGR